MDSRALRRYEDLPGPRGVPIFGNALQVDVSRFHQQLHAWSEQYGAIYRLRMLNRRVIVVGDHQLVAGILRDRPEGFRRTSRLEDLWREMGLPGGVFGANGEDWRRQRRMVMAGFDPAHVKRYFPAMQGVATRLARRWQMAAANGQAIDLQADLMRYTVDTIAGLAFGAEVNTLESDADVIQQHLDKFFPTLFGRLLAPVPTWRWLRTAKVREFERAIAEVKMAVDGFVSQARARLAADAGRRADPRNLLEAMIVAADEPSSGIGDTQVAGNVLTMLLAGEDTTANTLAWMIYLLWRNPATLQRVAAEVHNVVGHADTLTLEQMAQLQYLDACINETMRLKPVAPTLPLQALHDTTIGDVQVSAETVVINLMRRDSVSELHVPEAARFQPERWLAGAAEGDEAGQTRNAAMTAGSAKRVSMPFGAGPRICPGRYLALLEMKMAMATLLSHFEIQAVDTPDGQEAREQLAFTMAPVGLRMKLVSRIAG